MHSLSEMILNLLLWIRLYSFCESHLKLRLHSLLRLHIVNFIYKLYLLYLLLLVFIHFMASFFCNDWKYFLRTCLQRNHIRFFLKGSDRLCKIVEPSMQCCGKLLSDLFETYETVTRSINPEFERKVDVQT